MITNLIRKAKLGYSSSFSVRRLIDYITTLRPYFWIVKKRVDGQRKKDGKGPFNLVIETSNFCNAECVMCPHATMKRPGKVMDRRTYDKIVSRIKKENLPINKVFFSGLGEPLTDPSLVFRIKTMKELGFPVRLYTNASLLTAKISQQLVGLEVDEINISFNGATPAAYQKIMRLDFEKTVQNIDKLIRIRKDKQSKKPFIQISSIVIEEGGGEIKKHIENWRKKVDSVTVSLAHQWGGGVRAAAKTQFADRQINLGRVYPCRSLWHTIVIDSKGNFVICCRDYESRHVLGNIHNHSFANIQKSRNLKRFQRLHLEYRQDKLPKMCQKCNFPYQEGIEWFLPRAID